MSSRLPPARIVTCQANLLFDLVQLDLNGLAWLLGEGPMHRIFDTHLRLLEHGSYFCFGGCVRRFVLCPRQYRHHDNSCH